ncbi:MAG: hypothetical protein ACHQZR_00520 [Candidatus Limnocylindrales bacterium]
MHSRRARVVNLTVLVVALSVPISLLDGPAYWAGVASLMLATAVAAGAQTSERPVHGLPLATRILPMLAAFAAAGLAHLAGADATWLLALALGAAPTATTLLAELRLAGPADDRRPHLERQMLTLVIVLVFAAFTAAAGAIEGGLGTTPNEAGDAVLTISAAGLMALALIEAAIAGAVGYRLAALRTTALGEALRVAGTYAVVTGVTAALLRAIDLPRLFGPAVLAGVFYLWSAYREASAAQRRTATWLWEYGLLVGALLLVVGWNLLLR